MTTQRVSRKIFFKYSPIFLSLISVNAFSATTDLTVFGTRTAQINLNSFSNVTVNSGATVSASSSSASLYGTGADVTNILNNGTITNPSSSGRGIELSSSSVSSIVNNGTITANGHVIEVASSSTVGSITNTGTMTSSSAGWGDESGIRIQGSEITGNIDNSGTISGAVYGINLTDSGASVDGSIINTGSISGGTTGIVNAGTIGTLDNSGTITGGTDGVRNTGTITNFTNSGTITGSSYSIYNSGTITNGITNTGTLDGDVYLGGTSLKLLGTSAEVDGSITGTSASSIDIGDGSTATSFSSADDANVGSLTIFNNATLELTSGTTWSSDTATVNSGGTLTLDNGSSIGDSSNSDSTITNNGSIYLGDSTTSSVTSALVKATTTSGSPETATIYGNLTNNGVIDLTTYSNTVGSTLTVDGDYTGGTDSSLYLGTVLDGDSSTTDKFVVTGDASGSTTVYFTNKGGTGAQTLNGIEVIEVDGTNTATFTQGNRIVAGAYDYTLTQSGSSYYLNSALTSSSSSSSSSSSTESLTSSTVRPEIAAYAGNAMASNQMFNLDLNDYAGKSEYLNSETGRFKPSNVWVRTEAGLNHFNDQSGQLTTHGKHAVAQVGADMIHWNPTGKQVFAIGVMGGAGDYRGTTRSHESGDIAKGESAGVSAGVYGRWLQNADIQDGAYANVITQWGYFNNSVHGDDLDKETYNSNGATVSAQTGYTQSIGQAKHHFFWVQPNAKATWMNVRADQHTESNGTYVDGVGYGNLQTAVGAKVFMTQSRNTATDLTTLNPYIESNWIHNTKNYGAKMNGTEDDIVGTKNIAEAKVGVEAAFMHNMHLSGSIGQQWGTHSYRDTSMNVLAKLDF